MKKELKFNLIPKLKTALNFIPNQWQKLWFYKQLFDNQSENAAIFKYFTKHCSKEDSAILIKESKIIKEFKLVE